MPPWVWGREARLRAWCRVLCLVERRREVGPSFAVRKLFGWERSQDWHRSKE